MGVTTQIYLPAGFNKTNWDAVYAHKARTDNPHAVTAALVGLGSSNSVQFGMLGLNTTPTGAQFYVKTSDAAVPAIIAQAVSGQSSNLCEWKDSGGTTRAYVKADGVMMAASIYASALNDSGSANNSVIRHGGSNKTITMSTNNVNRALVDSAGVTLIGASNTHALRFGNDNTGNWRIVPSAADGDLLMQKWNGSAWVTKQTISGA